MPKVSQASHTAHHYRSHHLHSAKRHQTIATFSLVIILMFAASTCLCATVWNVTSNLWELHFPPPSTDSDYSLIGKPSISTDFINHVLAYYHSPAQGKGRHYTMMASNITLIQHMLSHSLCTKAVLVPREWRQSHIRLAISVHQRDMRNTTGTVFITVGKKDSWIGTN